MPLRQNRSCRAAHTPAKIEGLEGRRLLSASPVHLGAVTPAKISAGATGYETVTIRNATAAAVTESVTVSLTPSLDGTTAVGAVRVPGADRHCVDQEARVGQGEGAVRPGRAADQRQVLHPCHGGRRRHHLRRQGAGPVHTGRTARRHDDPEPGRPLLRHRHGSAGTGNGGSVTHEFGFIWQTTAQTPDSLSGTFYVGNGNATGTMTGQESTDGSVTYTLTSADINYTLKGKVTPDGSAITGTIHGTLVNNLFKRIDGKFTLTRQPS